MSTGYLRGEHSHLYLFDLATKKAEMLTGRPLRRGLARLVARRPRIAFVRRHGEQDVDKAPNRDLFVIDARPGARAGPADHDDG